MWQDRMIIAPVDLADPHTYSGSVWIDNDEDSTDNDTANTMTIDTAWIALDGKQGWQRIYWAALMGTYKSPHTFNVGIYYDYSETVAETKTITLSADSDPLQERIKPARQKCQAIRFRISDTGQSGTDESYSLSHLQLQVGIKGGLKRLAKAQTA